MAVHVHIDRLIVEAADVRPDDVAALRSEIEIEIRRRFASAPPPHRSRRERLVRSTALGAGTPLAHAVATSVYAAAAGAS